MIKRLPLAIIVTSVLSALGAGLAGSGFSHNLLAAIAAADSSTAKADTQTVPSLSTADTSSKKQSAPTTSDSTKPAADSSSGLNGGTVLSVKPVGADSAKADSSSVNAASSIPATDSSSSAKNDLQKTPTKPDTTKGMRGINTEAITEPGYKPLFESTAPESPLKTGDVTLPEVKPKNLSDTTIIDFEKRQVTFMRYDKVTGIPVWTCHFAELEDYLRSMEHFNMEKLWAKAHKKEGTKKKEAVTGIPELAISLPVNYPAWARRILGKEPPKLSIKGWQSVSFSVTGTNIVSGGVAPSHSVQGPNFDFDNSFTIKGSIGRLINIEIKTGKDGTSGESFKDQLKKMKVEYKADPDSADQLEDDVIQEVTAGYTNFAMPGQGLAGYGGSAEGLFGIRVKSQWGPLSLTTIVSRENSQNQTKDFSTTGSSNDMPTTEDQFKRDKRFFLDSLFLLHYLDQTKSIPTIVKGSLFVYKKVPTVTPGQQWYYANTDHDILSQTSGYFTYVRLRDGIDYVLDASGRGWITLTDSMNLGADGILAVSYKIDPKGAAFSDGTHHRGDTTVIRSNDSTSHVTLYSLKYGSYSTNPHDRTYWLMWRNIYSMPGGVKPDGFTMDVQRITTDGSIQQLTDGNKKFTTVLNLAGADGIIKSGEPEIFDFGNGIVILPPYGDKAKGNLPFTNTDLGKYNGATNTNPDIYNDSIINSTTRPAPMFKIIMNGGSSHNYSFQLGFGVAAGSETVKDAGGEILVKDKDYSIDYESGQLDLISTKAQATSKISVQYSSDAMLMFDSKDFLGAYARLNLPGISPTSFIASTVMGEFMQAQRKVIPRIGSEAYNRFLYDMNLHLEFAPDWMTEAVNFLPLVSSGAASVASLDVEGAYSLVKPKTIDNTDKNREAYIEDFQSANKEYSLDVSQNGWYHGSIPVDIASSGNPDGYYWNPPSWKTFWYSPLANDNPIKLAELHALDSTSSANPNDQNEPTLRWVNQPFRVDTSGRRSEFGKAMMDTILPCASIMTVLPGTLNNRDGDKFFTFWIKVRDTTNLGQLYIDFGQVSNDVSWNGGPPNGNLDREKNTVQDGEYDGRYDHGLDTLPDSKEYYLIPDSANPGYWDSLGYGNTYLNDYYNRSRSGGPSDDDWAPYGNGNGSGDISNRSKCNGLENDGKLSSEDISGNGFTTAESFYRYKLNLSTMGVAYKKYVDPNTGKEVLLQANPLIDRNTLPDSLNKGWYFIRIPIGSQAAADTTRNIARPDTTVGSPAWNNIRYVRLVWRERSKDSRLGRDTIDLAEMRFEGSMWNPILPPSVGVDKNSSVVTTVVNSKDNSQLFENLVKRQEYDADGKTPKKEYALMMKWAGLDSGTAYVSRYMGSNLNYQKINITNSKELRFHLKTFGAFAQTDSTFFFRFGNNDSCYYEFRPTHVVDELTWQTREGVRIVLEHYAKMKLSYFAGHGEKPPRIDTTAVFSEGTYRIHSTYATQPTFSDIQWMAVGLDMKTGEHVSDTGSLMIHGIEAWGLESYAGWAFRADFKSGWADLLNTDATASFDDANFRQMADDPGMTKDAKLAASLSSQLNLQKFTPQKWGVSLPIGAQATASLTRPKYRPGSDILLAQNGQSDNLSNMSNDFADMILRKPPTNETTPAERYQTTTTGSSAYISYGKNGTGVSPATNLTADRITTKATYTRDTSTTYYGKMSSDTAFLDSLKRLDLPRDAENNLTINSDRKYDFEFHYDLSPRKMPFPTSLSPFGKSKSKFLPKPFKMYKLNAFPSRFNFDLLNSGTEYANLYNYSSLQMIETKTRKLTVNHAFQYAWAPLDPLIKTNYDISLNRVFDAPLAADSGLIKGTDKMSRFTDRNVLKMDTTWGRYFITSFEKSRSQHLGIQCDPQFVDWLVHTADYSNSSDLTPRTLSTDSLKEYLTSGVHSTFKGVAEIRFRSLVTNIGGLTKPASPSSKKVDAVGKNFDKFGFNSIRFEYSATCDLTDDYIYTNYLDDRGVGTAGWYAYQWGFKDRSMQDIVTGNMNDHKDFGGVYNREFSKTKTYDAILWSSDKRNTDQNYSISSPFRIPPPLNISLTPTLKWDRKYTVSPDRSIDTTVTFPDISVAANSNVLEKIPIVMKALKAAQLNSLYDFTLSSHKTARYGDTAIQDDRTRTTDLNPLIGFKGTVKRIPIDLVWNLHFKKDTTYTIKAGSTTNNFKRSRLVGNIMSVAYTVKPKKDRSVTLFKRWTIPIKGELKTQLDVAVDRIRTVSNLTTNELVDKDLDIHPTLSYNFTDNISGLAEYDHKKTYTALADRTTTTNNVTVSVKISF